MPPKRKTAIATIPQTVKERMDYAAERDANPNGDRLPAPWMHAFLVALSKGMLVSHACLAAGVTTMMARRAKQTSARFSKAWDSAIEMAVEVAEEEAYKRGLEGSDRLLEFWLKSHRPEVYGDKKQIEIGPSEKGPAVIELRAVDYRTAVQALAPIEQEELVVDANYTMLPDPVPAGK